MRRVLLAACALMGAMLAPRAAAQGLDDLVPMATEELQEMRGGFLTAGGFVFDFGAIVRTTIDGQPALETRLTWTPDGVLVEDLSAMAANPLPDFGGIGLVISDATGMTTVGHRLNRGELQGFIFNSGNGRDIRQDMEITLTLPGFDAVQRGMLTDRLGMRIGMDVADGLVRSSAR